LPVRSSRMVPSLAKSGGVGKSGGADKVRSADQSGVGQGGAGKGAVGKSGGDKGAADKSGAGKSGVAGKSGASGDGAAVGAAAAAVGVAGGAGALAGPGAAGPGAGGRMFTCAEDTAVSVSAAWADATVDDHVQTQLVVTINRADPCGTVSGPTGSAAARSRFLSLRRPPGRTR
jgi:hypothetical protein